MSDVLDEVEGVIVAVEPDCDANCDGAVLDQASMIAAPQVGYAMLRNVRVFEELSEW